MGVTGLWRLIEPAGKPVPIETLENKILAVDISIWLHQMVKGYQDTKGAPLPNAHLIGLFQRLCKLLYFRIKPVFVFDGAFPVLKKETIAKRQSSKAKYNSESERLKRGLALLLSKKTAISSLLGTQISPKKANNTGNIDDDIFKLPALPQKEEESESESDDEQTSSRSVIDLHSVDVESQNFKQLPVKEKYDLLIELKETRKMNSWGRLHELPKKSDNFSDFQMQRLLKRRKVQECLEETEKEMGDAGMSLNDLESLLNEEGIDTKIETLPTRRIASNHTARYLLIKNVKQALAEAKKKKEAREASDKTDVEKPKDEDVKLNKTDELEDDLQKAIKMSLEYVEDNDTSVCTSKTDDSWTSCMSDSDYSDSEGDDFEPPDMTSAKAYIMQYSDFTNKAINDLVAGTSCSEKNKKSTLSADQVIENINKEKSVIIDNIDISSDKDNKLNCQEKKKEPQIGKPSESPNTNTDLEVTQSSVICIENPSQEVITLDTSTEESSTCLDKIEDIVTNKYVNMDTQETSSSDDEFVDVPVKEPSDDECNKHVVQLTLNLDKTPENDIFADVFIKKTVIDGSACIKQEVETFQEHERKDRVNIVIEPCATNNVLDSSTSRKNIDIENKNVVNKSDIAPSLGGKVKQMEISNTVKEDQNLKDKSTIGRATVNESVKEKPTANEAKVMPNKIISTETLNSMMQEVQTEEQEMLEEKRRLDRIGRNITEQMTKEAQELLQIFGIPYIVAPMEAEAQCAFLEDVKLTDGTITDDSDIWLFGGKTVYKNFFNQKKHVLQFLSERIEKSYNLSREQLILLALLVGSDYTTGINGVGPVTALEILASFPYNKKLPSENSKQIQHAQIVTGLQEFKRWVQSGKRTDNTSLKKKLRNIDLNEDFPSVRVVQAYMEPNIEKSKEKFTWGQLDITVLRDYTKAKFGWSQNKLDEIIKPVLKRQLDRKSQKTVHDYFKRKLEFHSLEEQMSKRVKAAVQKMGPDMPLQEEVAGVSKTKKRKVNKSEKEADTGTKPDKSRASSSKAKPNKDEDSILNDHRVKVVIETRESGATGFEIKIPKTDRCQEVIPQREKDKQNLLQNKLKAIELFRKTNIDKKKKIMKKRIIQAKDKAELSESDSD